MKIFVVAEGVNVLVGDLSQRSVENLGDITTLGMVVTDEGGR